MTKKTLLLFILGMGLLLAVIFGINRLVANYEQATPAIKPASNNTAANEPKTEKTDKKEAPENAGTGIPVNGPLAY